MPLHPAQAQINRKSHHKCKVLKKKVLFQNLIWKLKYSREGHTIWLKKNILVFPSRLWHSRCTKKYLLHWLRVIKTLFTSTMRIRNPIFKHYSLIQKQKSPNSINVCGFSKGVSLRKTEYYCWWSEADNEDRMVVKQQWHLANAYTACKHRHTVSLNKHATFNITCTEISDTLYIVGMMKFKH